MFRPGREDSHHYPIVCVAFLEGLIALHLYATWYLRSHPGKLPWESGGAYKLLFCGAMLVFAIPNYLLLKDYRYYATPLRIPKPLRLTLAILSWILVVILCSSLMTAYVSLLKYK